MPKSKRDKKISLTKTGKKGLALKQKIVEDVRSCLEKYDSVYVFTCLNWRNRTMQDVKEEWKGSKFFFGKNRAIAIGFGRTKEEEIDDDIHLLSKTLRGQCALLFTNCKKKKVVKWFDEFSAEGYARSGFTVDSTIKLDQGPLKQFSHAIEPYLRQLGMPTKLDKGVVTLLSDYEVCKAGSSLTPEQAKILELLEYKLATLKLVLKACWIRGKGFEMLAKDVDESEMDVENQNGEEPEEEVDDDEEN